MGDPPGLIYPAGHGSGEITPPVIVYGILVVSYCYHGDGSRESIPNGDLPIVIWSCMLGTGEKKKKACLVASWAIFLADAGVAGA
jgi:hypothetical protein